MELRRTYSERINQAVLRLFGIEHASELSIPDKEFGDFATNSALRLANQLQKSPREIADALVAELSREGVVADVAGPGFINIRVSDSELWTAVDNRSATCFDSEVFVVEYSCPNYFKELHAGHLYQTLYGDAVARMIERSGAKVQRTNFGADVGLSAARAMWGILKRLDGELPEKLSDIAPGERMSFVAGSYVDGAQADTSGEEAVRLEIIDVNKRIYALHSESDTTSAFAQIYFTTREWCKDYFIQLYEELEVDAFEKFYPESSTEKRGVTEVRARIGTVFTESNGAIVYEGERDGLHTRVFITKENLPTYEAKDLGLVLMEMDDFVFDRRILVTGKEQAEYMKVVWRATDHVLPGVEAKMTHLTNGLIRFGDGQKMSSRLGNVTTAMDVIEAVRQAVEPTGDAVRDRQIYLGALKYELLKYKLGGDIAFDPKESVSMHGNSGPYLQYAAVRAKSILTRVVNSSGDTHNISVIGDDTRFDTGERILVRKLAQYSLVLEEATKEYAPHLVCTYLYELAQTFNQFYEKNQVLGNERERYRWEILSKYYAVLESGLGILGIDIPEKM